MKYQETTFEDYLASNASKSLHPITERTYDKYPPNIEDMHNLVFYGPPGSGKYTQVLRFLKKYSPSDLKYEKRVTVTSNKITGYYKISDVHMEVDMGMLGCNSKCMWHDIFTHVNDMLNAKSLKVGFVVCKNFHEVHNELLDIFYSYMQTLNHKNLKVSYILTTEHIGFIPENILGKCQIIPFRRPTKKTYRRCINVQISSNTLLEDINNIKNIVNNITILNRVEDKIVNIIIAKMEDVSNIVFLEFRDAIYDIFIYNIDVNECIYKIISHFIDNKRLTDDNISNVIFENYKFFRYYNNNYRPIYHLERFLYYICTKLHDKNNI